jgi:hypothetical protein
MLCVFAQVKLRGLVDHALSNDEFNTTVITAQNHASERCVSAFFNDKSRSVLIGASLIRTTQTLSLSLPRYTR